ncbi:MAG: DUF971 domain-containing protein [Hyphomicrobiales bacterium]
MDASSGEMPRELRLARDRKSLTVAWEDGSRSILPACVLRRHGRSADAVRARLDGRAGEIAADLSITAVEPVGAYAVNIAFSDGYRRGIYPWAYLARMAATLEQERPETPSA